jgi:hypothetical protein
MYNCGDIATQRDVKLQNSLDPPRPSHSAVMPLYHDRLWAKCKNKIAGPNPTRHSNVRIDVQNTSDTKSEIHPDLQCLVPPAPV